MRKFHFAQPFIASSGDGKQAVNNVESFDINSVSDSNQGVDTYNNTESTITTEKISGDNNGYVSGAIDLDRALAEYYKSLVH